MGKGNFYAIGAYILWGLLPVYWKAIQIVPASQILCHRIIWSLLFLAALLALTGSWQGLRGALQNRKTLLTFFAAACILALNWFVYIWAVNAGYIVETSLGYFINPLVSVLLGVVLLREKLRSWQWLPIGLAALGVLYLTFSYGSLPWIALTLAFSFGTYGLLKKTAALGALHGLALEMTILFVPALSYLLYLEASGRGAFGHEAIPITVLLAFAGVVTASPLLLFAAAARRINLSTLGILQYIAPTLQFLLGVLVYSEPFTHERMIGFSLIWFALLIYSLEGVVERRRAAMTQAAKGF
jgi:chloramphenicol-sensitive protein RarD